MVKTKSRVEIFEVVVENGLIKPLDSEGRLLGFGIDLADTIFEAVEARGYDCNGAGLTFKRNNS